MGIYADLAAKRSAGYDVELEGRVKAWIEGVLGRQLAGDFRESLCDGAALCEMINKLKPGTIKKIHRSSLMMFRRENFGFFQNACVALGCKPNETCVFEDVNDNKNMGQFLLNIVSLARNTQYAPGYAGPILQDAVKNSGPGTPGPTGPVKYIPSAAEQAAKTAVDAKLASRYVEHGIVMSPNAQSAPEGKHLGLTAAEKAAQHGDEAVKASRYVEHGIVMNPDENPLARPR